MSEIREDGRSFVGYEYKEIPVEGDKASFYLDCYESFGWVPDEHGREESGRGKGRLVLKRDRKIINKAELTRLQRHFEACVKELDALERSKTAKASVCAIVVGLIGTAFMAGSTFAVTHTPPLGPAVHRAGGAGLYRLDRAYLSVPVDGGPPDPNRRRAERTEIR